MAPGGATVERWTKTLTWTWTLDLRSEFAKVEVECGKKRGTTQGRCPSKPRTFTVAGDRGIRRAQRGRDCSMDEERHVFLLCVGVYDWNVHH